MNRDNFTRLKSWLKTKTARLITFLSAIIVIVTAYDLGKKAYINIRNQSIEKELHQLALKSDWIQLRKSLDAIESNKELRDHYFYYSGLMELTKARNFSPASSAEFYLRQITLSSEFFAPSLLLRMKEYKKLPSTQLNQKLLDFQQELSIIGYNGPYLYLSKYLNSLNLDFANINSVYKEFISQYSFILNHSYQVGPITVSRKEDKVNLQVYCELAAMNYLLLLTIVRNSSDAELINQAYFELNRLYLTKEAVINTAIGLSKMEMGLMSELLIKIRRDLWDVFQIEIEIDSSKEYNLAIVVVD